MSLKLNLFHHNNFLNIFHCKKMEHLFSFFIIFVSKASMEVRQLMDIFLCFKSLFDEKVKTNKKKYFC